MRWHMEESTSGIACVRQLCELFGRTECLCRTAAASVPRRGSAQSGGRGDCAKAEFAAARDQWRLLRAAAKTRNARRLHLHSASQNARQRGTPADPKFRTPFEVARKNEAAVFGSSRSDCEYAGTFFAPAIQPERSGIQISGLSGPGWRIANSFSARAQPGRHDYPLRIRTTNGRGCRSNAN